MKLNAAAFITFSSVAYAQEGPQISWGTHVTSSHRDRIYAAEQFSNTVSVTDPISYV